MGELINLDERREARRRRREGRAPARARAELFFDLACPFTYLAVERVERAFDDVIWTPASEPRLGHDPLDDRLAEERAAAMRMPLVWPDRHPGHVPAAMRVAAYAQECGRGAAFALAATRLAFCGGFDLDDPEILAEAAAAAAVALDDCLAAARNEGRDGAIEAAGRRLLACGVDRLPVLRVGRTLYAGEGQIGAAVAAARSDRVARV